MRRLLTALLVFASASVHADWMEASSDHFVVYGKTSERSLRRFTEQLERFDAAMSLITGTPRTKPSRSARVTIYVAGTEDRLRALYSQDGRTARYIAGFYMPRIEGPAAFVPRIAATSGDELDFSMVVLLHEYAHHFNAIHSRFPAPRWFSEGSAEFFASAGFGTDGSVKLGRAAKHRAEELFMAVDVTTIDLVDQAHYEKRRGDRKGYDAYYGRAWLMFHYLTFEPSRAGQLSAYSRQLAAGKPSREAAESVFGDLAKLDKELDRYMRRPALSLLTIKSEALTVGEISLRTLRPAEAEIMPVVMRSKRGTNSKEVAKEILAEARAVAGKFPGDPAVLAALAEAEYDAGNDDATVVAADAALALEPKNVNAHIHKGYALFRKADRAKDQAGMQAAQRAFVALNRLENDHPVPLVYFYRSFVAMGAKPTANAVAGLEKAALLAPYAHEIALNLAQRYLADGKLSEARAVLVPVAYNPHGGARSLRLRGLMQALEQADPADAPALAERLAAIGRPQARGAESDSGPDAPGDVPGGQPTSPDPAAPGAPQE
jgi:tetratricopeptide (TPR) repeat protein